MLKKAVIGLTSRQWRRHCVSEAIAWRKPLPTGTVTAKL